MKIELGEKIMKKFVALKLKKYSSVKENIHLYGPFLW